MLSSSVVDVFGNVGYHVYHALLLVKLHSVLREISKAHSFSDVESSAVWLHLSKQHLDEGRLSRAVVAYNSHLLKALEVVVEVL